jgi:hypothetical protein
MDFKFKKVRRQISTLTVNTNTKENTLNTLRFSLQKPPNIDLDGPEEMHFFNVRVLNNNKRLAYKFEQATEDNVEEVAL